MKVIYLLGFCCLCSGCEKYHEDKKLTSEHFDENEYRNMCHRIAKLDMVAVSPGSGLKSEMANEIRDLIYRYDINIPNSALVNNNILGSADSDYSRLNDFVRAINSNHKIIWAMRGGYGAYRLVTSLNCRPVPRVNKTVVGFSDITAINIFISQKWPNWRVIHAAVLCHLCKMTFSKYKFNMLLDILEEKIDSYDMEGILPLNAKAQMCKSVVGKLTGGNLTMIENSLKTCWEIQTDEKILFIEEVNETPERIYRSLYHLKEAGKLSKIRALVFGYFHNTNDQKKVRLYLKKFSHNLQIPVYITDQFGHGQFNLPLIYNAMAKIHDRKMTVYTKKSIPLPLGQNSLRFMQN